MSTGDAPSQPFTVLLVEDDAQMSLSTRTLLEREAYEVTAFEDAESCLEHARQTPADLVVLDVNLPGIDGIEACRQLRTFSDAYVIMLTGLDSETDRLIGLAVGADDYIVKPYSPRELVARIRAMQRRPHHAADPTVPKREFGELKIDTDAREVQLGGDEIQLSRTEYEILDVLSRRPKVTLSRQQLLEAVWGDSWFGDDHVIDVHISNLRRKLNDDPANPRYITTARGFGYRMGEG
jgi:DNA-binding response OmpR family regulator